MRLLFLLPLVQAGLASASILEGLGFGDVESQNLLARRATLGRRQDTGSATCRLSMGTSIWDSCASVLNQYNITLNYFMAGNPSIGPNCANFVPGSTYCISLGESNMPPQ